MRKIKVVHLTNYDFALKVQMLNYALYFRGQGYDISIVCNPGQWLKEDMYTPEGIFVKAIPFPSAITPLRDLRTLWQLYRYFRKGRFHIVDTHCIKPGFLGGLAGRLARIPIVIHTAYVFYIRETMSPMQRRFWGWIEKICFRCSDLVLLDNLEDVETAKRERFGPPDKFIYVGNGIDLTRFAPSRFSQEDVIRMKGELGIEPGEAVVGLIGRLVREKGFIEFFEAAKIIKEKGGKAKFVCVGPSQEKATAISPTSLIKELGLESEVLFLGVRWDIPELMSVMDVVVLPSHGIEGRSRVLMEAAAMGKPVVATNTRGCREVVKDGETGVLVPMKDAETLANAIMDLLSDREKAQRMGRAARKRAAMFDEHLYFWKTDAEYRRLLEAKLPTLDTSSLKSDFRRSSLVPRQV